MENDGYCSQLSEISVRKAHTSEVGYCNGCSDHADRVVKEFSLRGWSGRLCLKCEKELIRKLRSA